MDQSTAEDFEYSSRYSLVISADSLKWLNWDIVLPKIAAVLLPGCFFAIVHGRQFVDLPWAAELSSLIPKYSTNQDYRALDVIQELKKRSLFHEAGRHKTSKVAFSQTIEHYVGSIHTRNGFSRERMGGAAMAEFDEAVVKMVEPHAPDGVYHGVIQSEIVWGLPSVA